MRRVVHGVLVTRFSTPGRFSSTSASSYDAILNREEWTKKVQEFSGRCQAMLRGQLYKDPGHPIYNFILKYYFSMSPKCLTHYSPGANVLLKQVSPDVMIKTLAHKESFGDPLSHVDGGYVLDLAKLKFTASKRRAMEHVVRLLRAIDRKPPLLHCFGLHEWAMVYRNDTTKTDDQISSLSKFQSLPLRVSPEEIKRVLVPVEGSASVLRCTHYDAIRFFTSDSVGINAIKSPGPSRFYFNSIFACFSSVNSSLCFQKKCVRFRATWVHTCEHGFI